MWMCLSSQKHRDHGSQHHPRLLRKWPPVCTWTYRTWHIKMSWFTMSHATMRTALGLPQPAPFAAQSRGDFHLAATRANSRVAPSSSPTTAVGQLNAISTKVHACASATCWIRADGRHVLIAPPCKRLVSKTAHKSAPSIECCMIHEGFQWRKGPGQNVLRLLSVLKKNRCPMFLLIHA